MFEGLTSPDVGVFVFKIWYNQVDGPGKEQPTDADYLPGWVDPDDPNNFVAPLETEEEQKEESGEELEDELEEVSEEEVEENPEK